MNSCSPALFCKCMTSSELNSHFLALNMLLMLKAFLRPEEQHRMICMISLNKQG